jgi:hypothetical protein
VKYLVVRSASPRAHATGMSGTTRSRRTHSKSHRSAVRFDSAPPTATEGGIEEWQRDAPVSETASILIANLIADVVGLGLPTRMARSLESRLTTAIALLASPEPSGTGQSIEQLDSFIRRVEAMAGARISRPDAAALVDKATEIIQHI